MAKNKIKWEYGDFQTPLELAQNVCEAISDIGIGPKTIIEPTCGRGNFVMAAARKFSSVDAILAFDINASYIEQLRERTAALRQSNIICKVADFFSNDWRSILDSVDWPLLILGNPPWVTSAELGMLESNNLPKKENVEGQRGLDALTGKSNFDISEWMLREHIKWLSGRSGTIAMLCKTSVARKILLTEWKKGRSLYKPRMYLIDAKKYFGVSVDACLFVCESAQRGSERDCAIFPSLDAKTSEREIGYRYGHLVSDAERFDRRLGLLGTDEFYVWRSGIKHDCSAIMELEYKHGSLFNGLDEKVDIEEEYVYPLAKSSTIAGIRNRGKNNRYVIVTQNKLGEDTSELMRMAPKMWEYLEMHKKAFSGRVSRVYKDRGEFSIFGVGPYSFSPWKVAISGLYKQLTFAVIGPRDGKPTLVDDTVYFVACQTEEEATTLAGWLNSNIAREFFESMVFWVDKRPITSGLLKRLNIGQLAWEHGEVEKYDLFTGRSCYGGDRQQTLWDVTKL